MYVNGKEIKGFGTFPSFSPFIVGTERLMIQEEPWGFG